MQERSFKKILVDTIAVLGTLYLVLDMIAKRQRKSDSKANEMNRQNPLEGNGILFVPDDNDKETADGVKGHLEFVDRFEHTPGYYEKHIKRIADKKLSFCGLVVLSHAFIGISIAIWLDDSGPVIFAQKRLGQNKKYFNMHKFRSMKTFAPHDVPTYMLDNPEQYITRVGKFIRTHSLDELPQLWDIFCGHMSIIGPRPALWNQVVLVAERDKYCANDIKPGLTGWAQINGRDKLGIEEKARLDDEYINSLSLKMDIRVFLKSIHLIVRDDSIVEGKTANQ